MILTDVPLFGMLKQRMRWHEERQRLLAENIANSDTPGYRPRDLAPLAFERMVAAGPSRLSATHPTHLAAASGSGGRFDTARGGAFEVRPSGNAVLLEDEMLKVGQNQIDHQAATSLYQRGLGLLKTAMGRR